MTAVILTIHTIIVLGLIVVVLLQRSEGGALGMGGAGTGGGFMTGRGAANALTRTTSLLAALFFATSLGLAIFANQGEQADDVIDDLTGTTTTETSSDAPGTTTDDLLRTLGGDDADTAADVAPEGEGAPLTEEELLDAIGTETAPAGEASAGEAETAEETAPDPQ